MSSPGAADSSNPSQSAVSQSGVGVFTSFGAVSTRGITTPVPGVVDWQMCAWKDLSSGMEHLIIFHLPRVPLAPRIPANQRPASVVGVSALVRGGIDPGTAFFRRCVGIVVDIRMEL